jgi:hypothetical protein
MKDANDLVRTYEGIIADLQQNQPAAQAAPQQADDPLAQWRNFNAQLNQLVRDGEITEADHIAHVADGLEKLIPEIVGRQVADRLAELEQTRIAPLQERTDRQFWQSEAQKIQRTYGAETFGALAPRAKEIVDAEIASNPAAQNDPGLMDKAFKIAMGEQFAEQQRNNRARTLQGGGAGPVGAPAKPPQDVIWEEMRKAQATGGGGF